MYLEKGERGVPRAPGPQAKETATLSIARDCTVPQPTAHHAEHKASEKNNLSRNAAASSASPSTTRGSPGPGGSPVRALRAAAGFSNKKANTSGGDPRSFLKLGRDFVLRYIVSKMLLCSSRHQQTVTTATVPTCCLVNLVSFNRYQYRFRNHLWLQLQWLQSAGPMMYTPQRTLSKHPRKRNLIKPK